MVDFIATFLQNLQSLLVLIYAFMRKNTPFKWIIECQDAFDKLKALLIKPPTFLMPDIAGQQRLVSDTINVAGGAALNQFQDDGTT